MKVTVFAQSELLNDVHVLELDQNAGASGLRESLLSILPKGKETEELRFYVEDSDDERDFENLNVIPDGLRIHLHRLKSIDVTVRYAGRDVQRTFRPSATVRRVKHWAVRALNISSSDAAELMLQVSGTDTRPDPDTHIGTLVRFPTKALCFDLVPSTRVNG
jgi:hypothetical protein